jgi:tRNA nucleotidyltransferase (CCA-adding enzyme)
MDYYNCQLDLSNKQIKCVGNPNKRFREDALRIMRALRFAGELGFSIEDNTAQAMYDNRALLQNISAERINIELNKLLCSKNVIPLLSEHKSILAEIIPELIPTFGFEQNTRYHCYDVFVHILHSVDSAAPDIIIRLTMLLHDIAKPLCYTEEDGRGHFYGHPPVSADIASKVLKRLRYDNDTIDTVVQLILYHDAEISASHKNIKQWLNRIGEERFKQLLQVKIADAKAQTFEFGEKALSNIEVVSAELDIVLEQQQCFSLKDLAVNGNDLIELGVPKGVQVGEALNHLIEMVINEEVENDREVLLDIVRRDLR